MGFVASFRFTGDSKYQRSLCLLTRPLEKDVVSRILRPKTPMTGWRVGRQAQMMPTLISMVDQNTKAAEDPAIFSFHLSQGSGIRWRQLEITALGDA